MSIFDTVKRGLYYILEGTGLSASILGISSFIYEEAKKDIENPPEIVVEARKTMNNILSFPEKAVNYISSHLKTFFIITGVLAIIYLFFKLKK